MKKEMICSTKHLAAKDLRQGSDSSRGQTIDFFIVPLAGMARDFSPGDVVLALQAVELLPQIEIKHRLVFFRTPLPTIFLPRCQPALLKTVDKIGAVRMKADRARPLQSAQRFDGSGQLHAIIGGVLCAACQHLFVLVRDQNRGPASWTGIAGTGAVCVDSHFFHCAQQDKKFAARRQGAFCAD